MPGPEGTEWEANLPENRIFSFSQLFNCVFIALDYVFFDSVFKDSVS